MFQKFIFCSEKNIVFLMESNIAEILKLGHKLSLVSLIEMIR